MKIKQSDLKKTLQNFKDLIFWLYSSWKQKISLEYSYILRYQKMFYRHSNFEKYYIFYDLCQRKYDDVNATDLGLIST